MKITETIERECCQRSDLKPLQQSPKSGHIPRYMFCKYCGTHHQMHSFTDPAGGSDWEYRPIPPPWQVGR